MPANVAHKFIQRSQSNLRYFASVHDRPEDVMHGFAKFDGGAQGLLGGVRAGISPLREMLCLPVGEDSCIFPEADEVGILRQQLFRLVARTVVKSVDEVEAEDAGSKFEARRSMFFFFALRL